MSKKENPEDLEVLRQQLQTAKRILQKSGAILPNKEFFDPNLTAFDAKIVSVLRMSLVKWEVDEDIIKEVCKDFLLDFNTHIKAMTPFKSLDK